MPNIGYVTDYFFQDSKSNMFLVTRNGKLIRFHIDRNTDEMTLTGIMTIINKPWDKTVYKITVMPMIGIAQVVDESTAILFADWYGNWIIVNLNDFCNDSIAVCPESKPTTPVLTPTAKKEESSSSSEIFGKIWRIALITICVPYLCVIIIFATVKYSKYRKYKKLESEQITLEEGINRKSSTGGELQMKEIALDEKEKFVTSVKPPSYSTNKELPVSISTSTTSTSVTSEKEEPITTDEKTPLNEESTKEKNRELSNFLSFNS